MSYARGMLATASASTFKDLIAAELIAEGWVEVDFHTASNSDTIMVWQSTAANSGLFHDLFMGIRVSAADTSLNVNVAEIYDPATNLARKYTHTGSSSLDSEGAIVDTAGKEFGASPMNTTYFPMPTAGQPYWIKTTPRHLLACAGTANANIIMGGSFTKHIGNIAPTENGVYVNTSQMTLSNPSFGVQQYGCFGRSPLATANLDNRGWFTNDGYATGGDVLSSQKPVPARIILFEGTRNVVRITPDLLWVPIQGPFAFDDEAVIDINGVPTVYAVLQANQKYMVRKL